MIRTVPSWVVLAAALAVGCSPNSAEPTSGGGDPASLAARSTREDEAGIALRAARSPVGTPDVMARADVNPVSGGTVHGTVEFRGNRSGLVSAYFRLTGLRSGAHSVELYQVADCAATYEHSTASSAPVGVARAPLGTITVNESGIVRETLRIAGSHAEQALVGGVILVQDAGGLAVQPAGESPEPVACGVIEMVDGGRGV